MAAVKIQEMLWSLDSIQFKIMKMYNTIRRDLWSLNIKLKGAKMEGIYLYKDKLEEIKQMIEELGVSLTL